MIMSFFFKKFLLATELKENIMKSLRINFIFNRYSYKFIRKIFELLYVKSSSLIP